MAEKTIYYKKAEITVYLALTLSIMLSLILTLVEGARASAIRMQIECATDMGLNSAFAEFNRELLEQYDLLFIDTSYGMGMPSLANTEEHIRSYMEYNLNPTKETLLLNIRDWMSLEMDQLMITEESLATDEGGAVCKRQAVRYMKDKTGISMLGDIGQQLGLINSIQTGGRNIESEQSKVHQEIADELPMRQNEKGEWNKVTIDNPADMVNDSRGMGILNLIIDNPSGISAQNVALSQYISYRKANIGSGLPDGHEAEEGMPEEFLFGEYLIEKCGSYRNKLDKSLLKYQLEYLLEGKNSDTENLKSVANKLLLLREASNAIYLFGNQGKLAEADAAAAVITAAILLPEIQPLVKYSILLAWTYAESVRDVKVIMEGGKVPLIKNSQDWKIKLSNLPNFKNHLKDGIDENKGLDYKEYLRLFLLLMNKEEKASRFMDVMEMDIRQTEGNLKFRIDGCVDSFMADIGVTSKFGYQYQIRRFYCYE